MLNLGWSNESHCRRAELEKRNGKFDIIVGDLADPVEGGPCYQLYTKSFYEKIIKPKLNKNGIFVTQVPFSQVHHIFAWVTCDFQILFQLQEKISSYGFWRN